MREDRIVNSRRCKNLTTRLLSNLFWVWNLKEARVSGGYHLPSVASKGNALSSCVSFMCPDRYAPNERVTASFIISLFNDVCSLYIYTCYMHKASLRNTFFFLFV